MAADLGTELENTDTEKTPRAPASGLYEHYCQHPGCKIWGGFGFARGRGGEYDWFCYSHRPDRDPQGKLS